MKIELGKTYMCNDGYPCRIVAIDRVHPTYKIAGLAMNGQGQEDFLRFDQNGQNDPNPICARNLLPNTVKKEYWGVSYKSGGGIYYITQSFNTKEEAEKLLTSDTARAYKYVVHSFIREEEI